MTGRLHAVAAAALAVCMAGAAAQAAEAGTASIETGPFGTKTLRYSAPGADANDIEITRSGGTFHVRDFRAAVTPGAGCVAGVGPNEAQCNETALTRVVVDAGPGADRAVVAVGPMDVLVNGGAGNDTLTTEGGNDTLHGDEDDDTLVYGSAAGQDTLDGDVGRDRIDLSQFGAEAQFSLDGAINDGPRQAAPSARNDRAVDAEDLTGTEFSDLLMGSGEPNSIDGLAGADSIDGGAGTDEVDYSDRDEAVLVTIGAGDDDGEDGESDNVEASVENVVGGSGGDAFVGTLGANRFSGGDGLDIVGYIDHTTPVAADLDVAIGDDGSPAEGDTIDDDVEGLVGGEGSDTLIGNDRYNVFRGAGGADTIAGLGDYDAVHYGDHADPVRVDLDGESGDDGSAGEGDSVAADVEDIYGGTSDDVIVGNDADNYLFGNAGADDVTGGANPDLLSGDEGDDTLRARDDVLDAVDCGDGTDTALVDELDESFDCELFSEPSAAQPPAQAQAGQSESGASASGLLNQLQQGSGDVTPPVARLTVPRQKLRQALAKGLKVKVKTDEAATIAADAALPGRRRTVVGRGSQRTTKAGTTTVTIKFTKAQRRRLALRRSVKLQVQIVATDAGGNRADPIRKGLTLKR